MNLSRNFTLSELIKSDTAIRKGINNNPNAEQIEKLKALCENVTTSAELRSPADSGAWICVLPSAAQVTASTQKQRRRILNVLA